MKTRENVIYDNGCYFYHICWWKNRSIIYIQLFIVQEGPTYKQASPFRVIPPLHHGKYHGRHGAIRSPLHSGVNRGERVLCTDQEI